MVSRFADIEATPTGETYFWVENERELRAEIWRGLVLNKTEPNENNKTFDVYAIYKDRWPVEQIPLSAEVS